MCIAADRRDIGSAVHVYIAGRTAVAATAPHAERCARTFADGAADTEAAVTTTAANALRQHAVGMIAVGADVAGERGSVESVFFNFDHADPDVAAAAAVAAGATEADCCAGSRGQGTGDAEAAGAAATAGALCDDRV